MKYLLKRGAGVGMAAGAMMAMFSMLAMAVSGNGFWTPLNAIAHTLWKGAPLDGQFSLRALVVGVVVDQRVGRRCIHSLGAVLRTCGVRNDGGGAGRPHCDGLLRTGVGQPVRVA
jgi:hypothetical protein